MQEQKFIVREPLLNAQGRVLGYRLGWQQGSSADAQVDEADTRLLVDFIAAQVDDMESGSLLGEHLLFLDAPASLVREQAFSALPKKRTVLSVRAAELGDAEAVQALKALHIQGYGVSLREADLASVDRSLLEIVSHVEISAAADDFADQVRQWRGLDLPALALVACDLGDWAAYDLCASMGVQAFGGTVYLESPAGGQPRELNPAQAMILQLMDMVKKGADVKQLEGVLKHDAAISYKLLRYINSAGFGLGCEIQSLRHAVTLLGYSPLYRWLALLMATATTTGYSPALMQTAVIRGRFAELLGQGFLPKSEAENLFVVGMFSLLDRLLGVPMEDVLEKVQLSDAVSEALLTRTGIYGPFISLAEACESNVSDIASMAGALCIGALQVNQAHLSALAWAQSLHL